MINALLGWLILVLIVSLIYWLISMVAPPQILRIVLVICVIVVVLALIFLLLPLAGIHMGGLH